MIEKRKGTMWLQSSYILLNAPEADQKTFENAFAQLKTRIMKGRAEKDHNWVLLSCGPERRRYAIIGYPYQHISKQTRNEMLNEILAREEMKNIRGILMCYIKLYVFLPRFYDRQKFLSYTISILVLAIAGAL